MEHLYEETCIELDLPLEEDATHRMRDAVHEQEANDVANHKTMSHAEKIEKLKNFHGQAKEHQYRRAAKTIAGQIGHLEKTMKAHAEAQKAGAR